jgi:hypothetical protein
MQLREVQSLRKLRHPNIGMRASVRARCAWRLLARPAAKCRLLAPFQQQMLRAHEHASTSALEEELHTHRDVSSLSCGLRVALPTCFSGPNSETQRSDPRKRHAAHGFRKPGVQLVRVYEGPQKVLSGLATAKHNVPDFTGVFFSARLFCMGRGHAL